MDTPNGRSTACQSGTHGVCQGYTEPLATYTCACICHLIEASSLGTPEAKAARESVTDEQVARVIAFADKHQEEE
jgi:hypothetical protein